MSTVCDLWPEMVLSAPLTACCLAEQWGSCQRFWLASTQVNYLKMPWGGEKLHVHNYLWWFLWRTRSTKETQPGFFEKKQKSDWKVTSGGKNGSKAVSERIRTPWRESLWRWLQWSGLLNHWHGGKIQTSHLLKQLKNRLKMPYCIKNLPYSCELSSWYSPLDHWSGLPYYSCHLHELRETGVILTVDRGIPKPCSKRMHSPFDRQPDSSQNSALWAPGEPLRVFTSSKCLMEHKLHSSQGYLKTWKVARALLRGNSVSRKQEAIWWSLPKEREKKWQTLQK